MALSKRAQTLLIGDSYLDDWQVIGSGGFGQIYKARHQQWCCDVAIKLLHYDDGRSTSLLREADMMCQGSNPYVIRVLGVFKGQLPSSGPSQLGLVMEFMERGSLASLQETLNSPPPWPLVFRLAHQVALGINFLHSLSPPLLHLDLKPSNVLLDSDLNAKLTDFGLARFCHSVTRASKKASDEEGGTISYMPPEAFEISYSPTRASDIYSYGILLWSIVTGKQPYANALSSIVRFRIPQGDRPSLKEISCQAAGHAGLTVLTELMKKCWAARPDQRPSAFECTTVTEELYKMRKHAIVDTVHQLLKKLNEKEEQQTTKWVQRVHVTQAAACPGGRAVNNCYNVPTGRPPVQEMASGWTTNQKDETRVKDHPSPRCASVSRTDHNHTSVNYKLKPSSVCPIASSPQSTSTSPSPQASAEKSFQAPFRESLSPQYLRQFSSPDTCSGNVPVERRVCIHLSNVTGFQNGSNNTMNIYTDLSERKRHPTAPSSVDLPSPRAGIRKDRAGGAE